MNNVKAVDYNVFFKYLHHLIPYKNLVFISVILLILSVAFHLLPSLFYREIIDEAIPDKDFQYLLFLSLLSILAVALSSLSDFLEEYFTSRYGASMVCDLRKRLYSHLISLPMNCIEKLDKGHIVSLFTSDLAYVQNAYSKIIPSIITNVLTIVISAILLFSQNVKLAFLCLVPIPLYFLYMSFSAKKIKTTVDTISNYGDKLTGRVIEDLSIFGITFSRLNSTYRVQEGELSVIADLIKGTKVRLNLLYRSNQIFNVFTTSIGISLLYFYGGLLMLDEEVTVGTIVLFTVLAYKIYQPLSFLSFNMVEISTCISSLQRIDRIFSISPDNRFAIASGSANASKELLNDQFAIEFNNVSFSFSESSNKHCLNKISIAIEKGKKVAIVGGNGAGKSTLAMLIAGLYNSTSGDVRLFGNKVSDLSFSDLSKIVGVAFSSNFFFDGTILENLKIVRQNASDNEIDDSLRKSLCSGFLNEITNGVHSKIQSDGHNLSSGQKQRLALARLLLKQTPIFILDEVTANIDAESESDIFNSIKMLPDDVTVLVISHNVNVIKNFDLILFMHDGDLISSGSFKELSSNCAGFRELFNLNSLVNYKSEVA